jgi:threonine/homoserine/homoserine lactone efflux protein
LFASLILGGGYAFAAAVQPGPLQAFLLSSVARRGWRRTLPASLAPLVSDGPIALVILLVISRVPEAMSTVLQMAGGILLLYFALASYRQWRRQLASSEGESERTPPTLLQAAAVNILNPNPYLGWSLVLGPAAVRAWHERPMDAVALVGAFYVVLVITLAVTIILFGTSRFLGARGRRALILASAVILACLGAYEVGAGLRSAIVA